MEQVDDAFCTYSRFTETEQYDQFVAFQPNSATLWPGTVVRGLDAAEGVLTPIGVELVLTARVREAAERKSLVDVEIAAGGVVTATGEVVAVRMPESMRTAGPPS